jgi:mevalonate kinase
MFAGKLAFRQNTKTELDKRNNVDPEFSSFYQYLQMASKKGELQCDFDLSSFRFDMEQGLFFRSTIPAGYGLGSSGALCAAIYAKYVKDPIEDLNELNKCLAKLEAHFHGRSSGLDPLVSYVDRPILQNAESQHVTVDYASRNSGSGGLFLINTGRPRRTEPLVSLFLEKCKLDDFNIFCQEKLKPTTNACIDSFLSHDDFGLWNNFHDLSEQQYENFLPMIPPLYRELWKTGLDSNFYKLKLCGAGGGGFLMGVTKDLKKTERLLKHPLKKLYSLF